MSIKKVLVFSRSYRGTPMYVRMYIHITRVHISSSKRVRSYEGAQVLGIAPHLFITIIISSDP